MVLDKCRVCGTNEGYLAGPDGRKLCAACAEELAGDQDQHGVEELLERESLDHIE